MKILKAELFLHGPKDLLKFVNSNNIQREDILIITEEATWNYTIFYYGEAEQEDKRPGFWG